MRSLFDLPTMRSCSRCVVRTGPRGAGTDIPGVPLGDGHDLRNDGSPRVSEEADCTVFVCGGEFGHYRRRGRERQQREGVERARRPTKTSCEGGQAMDLEALPCKWRTHSGGNRSDGPISARWKAWPNGGPRWQRRLQRWQLHPDATGMRTTERQQGVPAEVDYRHVFAERF